MGVLENLAKNPAVLGIAAVGIIAFIFRDRISDFLSNITGGAATANILGENLLSNLKGTQDLLNNLTTFLTTNPFENFEFPTFEFPEFPTFDFGSFFENFFGQFGGGNGGGNGPDLPPDVEDTGLLTPEERAACGCGTNIIQDIQGDVSETCISPCDIPEEGDPDFIGPVQPDEPEPPFVEPEEPEPFQPPVELPPGFVGEGPSFEGGTIFERDPCFMTLSEIIDAGLASSASAAANVKAIACSANVTEEPTDFPEDFDFGTNTGSGFGPGDDQSGGIVTGGATLESEEKKAACVSCELFGLNCPICAGTI